MEEKVLKGLTGTIVETSCVQLKNKGFVLVTDLRTADDYESTGDYVYSVTGERVQLCSPVFPAYKDLKTGEIVMNLVTIVQGWTKDKGSIVGSKVYYSMRGKRTSEGKRVVKEMTIEDVLYEGSTNYLFCSNYKSIKDYCDKYGYSVLDESILSEGSDRIIVRELDPVAILSTGDKVCLKYLDFVI